MHYLYNEPSSPSLDLCLLFFFLRRGTPGCGSRSRVSPPGRPHRFHKPSPAQTAPSKSTMALGNLTKGASWEELIQACLQSFGKFTFAHLRLNFESDTMDFCSEKSQRAFLRQTGVSLFFFIVCTRLGCGFVRSCCSFRLQIQLQIELQLSSMM